jgi:hypothetical protein
VARTNHPHSQPAQRLFTDYILYLNTAGLASGTMTAYSGILRSSFKHMGTIFPTLDQLAEEGARHSAVSEGRRRMWQAAWIHWSDYCASLKRADIPTVPIPVKPKAIRVPFGQKMAENERLQILAEKIVHVLQQKTTPQITLTNLCGIRWGDIWLEPRWKKVVVSLVATSPTAPKSMFIALDYKPLIALRNYCWPKEEARPTLRSPILTATPAGFAMRPPRAKMLLNAIGERYAIDYGMLNIDWGAPLLTKDAALQSFAASLVESLPEVMDKLVASKSLSSALSPATSSSADDTPSGPSKEVEAAAWAAVRAFEAKFDAARKAEIDTTLSESSITSTDSISSSPDGGVNPSSVEPPEYDGSGNSGDEVSEAFAG